MKEQHLPNKKEEEDEAILVSDFSKSRILRDRITEKHYLVFSALEDRDCILDSSDFFS